MAEQSDHDSTMEELEEYIRTDEDCRRLFGISQNEGAVGNVNESPLSTVTTPNPLNTAFLSESYVSEHSQISLSQPQSQTTKEASSTIHGLIETIIEEENNDIVDLRSPTKIMATIVKTPTKISTGTIPKTPMMVSTGTMPKTPIMVSTGTMPKTPIMVSTGTMPKTPTMVSTSTMPKTPTTIDLVSPTIETIDLCSPPDPSTNTDSSHSPPHLAPPQ